MALEVIQVAANLIEVSVQCAVEVGRLMRSADTEDPHLGELEPTVESVDLVPPLVQRWRRPIRLADRIKLA